MDVYIHGSTIPLDMNKIFRGKPYTYTSPTVPGRTMIWSSRRRFRHFEYECTSEDGSVRAVFTRSGWSQWKKIGSVRIYNPMDEHSDDFIEEVLAVGMAIWQYMVMYNAGVAIAS
jgi:hypothetical protein